MKRTILAVALVLVGCGSSAGSTGSAGGGTGGNGGGSGAGGGSASITGPAGYVQMSFSRFSDASPSVFRIASAQFYSDGPPVPLPGGSPSCVSSQVGGCQVEDCIFDGGTTKTDGGKRTNAGALTIEVGTDGGVAIPFDATANVYMLQDGAPSAWWAGGDTISVKATGSTDGGAPAFASTLVAPSTVNFTSPPGTSATLTRNAEFVVSWSSGNGSIRLNLVSGAILKGHSVGVTCIVDASTGTYTLTPALTNLLLPGASGSMTIRAESITRTTAGTYTIETKATTASKGWAVTVL